MALVGAVLLAAFASRSRRKRRKKRSRGCRDVDEFKVSEVAS